MTAFIIGYFIPQLNNLSIDIGVRSGIVALLFILLILKTESSPDLDQKIRKNLKRFL
jgi:hypothetical protein